MKPPSGLLLLFAALIAVVIVSLGVGRYWIAPADVVGAILARFGGHGEKTPAEVSTILFLVRVPRAAAALLVGLSLSMAGLSYQTVFRNPIASPSLLGVSAGAGFGAALGLLLHWPWLAVQAAAFAGGLSTVTLALGFNRMLGGRSLVTLVLCGLVVAAFFESMISIVKYFADPLDTLPAITFWLLGGLEKTTASDVVLAAAPMLACALLLYLFRWRTLALTLSEGEASSLGVDVGPTRTVVIILSTLMVALAVSMAGVIGWVGLIVPHAARMLFGLSPNRLYPATALMGALFLLLVDDIARSAATAELPLGVLTAIIGAPAFLLLLTRIRSTAWT